ncbi:glycosyltransferase family 25 protein [uncultured Amaricoccus sp.]|uniref:glycosyltransferase family 25 protein n=1 Tax=uncultured Amaricoccus sp. TaxID=339341 RepID=UPI002626CB1C|nr:glycosyltransferase family 25 protein [uncultured Amaricoccus sp.]
MRAWVINLDRSPDRWAFSEAQGARLALDLTRVAAVDGQAIPDALHAELCPPGRRGVRITKYELACYLSHLTAWEALVATGASHGVVFEDDIQLADDAADFLDATGWLPAGADLVKLTANKRRAKLSLRASPTLNGRALRRLHSPTIDSAGYVISAAHAGRLLAQPRRFSRPVDRALFDPATGASVYQLDPGLCAQQKFTDETFLSEAGRGSTIQARRARAPLDISPRKLRDELRNLYRKQIFPVILPLLQIGRAEENRIRFSTVPFRKEATGG